MGLFPNDVAKKVTNYLEKELVLEVDDAKEQ